MKFLFAAMLLSGSALAQMPKMPSTSDLTDMSKKVMAACKEDKSKISGCESYTELSPLKACLMKNHEKLSETCKNTLKLVK
jgi:hypothetical protein